MPDRYAFKAAHLPDAPWINPGGSAIVDPDGRFLAEPVTEREEILYADLDLGLLRGSRFQLDVAGHYGSPDVFDLRVRSGEETMLHGGADVVDGRTRDDPVPYARSPAAVPCNRPAGRCAGSRPRCGLPLNRRTEGTSS